MSVLSRNEGALLDPRCDIYFFTIPFGRAPNAAPEFNLNRVPNRRRLHPDT